MSGQVFGLSSRAGDTHKRNCFALGEDILVCRKERVVAKQFNFLLYYYTRSSNQFLNLAGLLPFDAHNTERISASLNAALIDSKASRSTFRHT